MVKFLELVTAGPDEEAFGCVAFVSEAVLYLFLLVKGAFVTGTTFNGFSIRGGYYYYLGALALGYLSLLFI